ncbi:hypothetical protein DICPUDRAFT_84157 [Dictyostelium purpureum]|uniref:SAP domain-containing protein n=1 Tax=Dictyostelium purpureum TaxID=5786 RepID=F1A1R4_DICPU|nr:uncharacterized protein DICPUDRAFT_84157 [Dictyostelium purpureum]EGC29867.1 hypothetical protein DICPUDRAFT_84157 [Dictyostelium purpureum]|eukprot:XP_003293604.1 hypothetical protein DICPUDRAFT_84157 [Dictyostelium purpureum]
MQNNNISSFKNINYSKSIITTSTTTTTTTTTAPTTPNKNTLTLNKFKRDYNIITTPHKEFKLLAKQINVSTEGLKLDLYKRIENYLKIQRNIKNEDRINSSINSFNKYPPKLEINKTTDSLELLFWGVFRSKSIFKTIFSNFKYNQLFGYQDLFGVQRVINRYTNYEAIIIDKLKSGGYLITGYIDIIAIFETIREDTAENRELYRLLFIDYPTKSFAKPQFNDSATWLPVIIQKYNIVAFNQYVGLFNINKETVRQLFNNIKPYNHQSPNKFNSSNLNDKCYRNYRSYYFHIRVLKHYDPDNNTRKKYQFNSLKGLEMYNHLKKNQYIPNTTKLLLLNIFSNVNLYDKEFKLKDLISYYNSLLEYNKNNTIVITLDSKYNSMIAELASIQNILYIEHLNSTVESIVESVTLSNTIINNNCTLKNIMYKYFKIIYAIYKKYKIINKSDLNGYYKPLQYYLFFKEINNKILDQFSNEMLKSSIDQYIGITHIHKKEKIKEIVSTLINENKVFIDNASKNRTLKILHRNYEYLVYSFLKTSDTQLMDLLLKEERTQQFLHPHRFVASITDPSILDHYFNSSIHQIIFAEGNDLWQFVTNEKVMDQYETLMKAANRKFDIMARLRIEILNEHNIPISNILKWYERALCKPEVYQCNHSSLIEEIKKNRLFLYCVNEGNQDSVISFLSKYLEYYPIKSFDMDMLNQQSHKIMNWLLQDFSCEKNIFIIENNQSYALMSASTKPITTTGNTYYLNHRTTIKNAAKYLFWAGRIDMSFDVIKIDQQLSTPANSLIYYINFERCLPSIIAFKVIDSILADNSSESEKHAKLIFEKIISKSTKNGELHLLKRIILKNKNIFKINNPTLSPPPKNMSLSLKDLRWYIDTSLSKHHQEVTHFLMSNINLSNSDVKEFQELEMAYFNSVTKK